MDFLDRFNRMPMRHGLPPVSAVEERLLSVTKNGQVTVDYPDAKSLLSFITEYADQQKLQSHTTFAQLYRSELDPEISSWKVAPYAGSTPARELRWEPVGTDTVDSIHIDRYLLHHSTYLEMPLLHFHKDQGPPHRGSLLWLRVSEKASEKDWPVIHRLIDDGYEVFSFDFRGLGQTRMNYRAISPDDPSLAQGDIDQAYVNPLSSVLADYVYNSILTGRPYFLQMLDDIKIASLFIRSKSTDPSKPLTILAATAETSTLANHFKEIEPAVAVLAGAPPDLDLQWSAIVAHKREKWPIFLLMPSGALLE